MNRILPPKVFEHHARIKREVWATENGWDLVTYNHIKDGRTVWGRVGLEYKGHRMAEKMSTLNQLRAKLKEGQGCDIILSNWIKEVTKKDKKKIRDQRAIAKAILKECDELEALYS